MKIDTKYFGEMNVDEEKIIYFANGLPGFLDEKKFVLLDLPENEFFHLLQSVSTKEIALVVANPYHFFKDYEFDIDETTLSQLEIKKEKDVSVLGIVTLREPFKNSTINLQAPVILNNATYKGKQIILNDSEYKVRQAFVSQKEDEAYASTHKKG